MNASGDGRSGSPPCSEAGSDSRRWLSRQLAVKRKATGRLHRATALAPPGLGTSFSGEVWIQSHERLDTLGVCYAIPRGEDETPPWRVLLPVSLFLRDAAETHVWGVWWDELDAGYVVGRRLVPGGSGWRRRRSTDRQSVSQTLTTLGSAY